MLLRGLPNRNLVCTAFLLLLLPSLLRGQGNTPSAEVREAKPDLIYILDKNGNLVPILDMSWEQFQNMYDRERGGRSMAGPPAYSIQRLMISGRVDSDRARLKITADILLKQPGWIRIPLRFGEVVSRELPNWDGAAEHFLHFEIDDGYVWWVKGQDNKTHQLQWEAEVPIRETGRERRIQLSAPRSTTSEFKLQVPSPQVSARTNEGSGLLPATHPTPESTEFTAIGIPSDFQLSWRTAEVGAAPAPLLESLATISVQVADPRQIRAEARIRLTSNRGSIGPFKIRLPPGMRYEPFDDSGYTVISLREDLQGQLLEIRPDGRVASPWDFRLKSTLNRAEGSESVELGGFEIEGAIRQTGSLEISVDDGWRVEVVEESNVRRLDIGDEPPVPRLAYRCEFSRQPLGLPIRILKLNPIRVEPKHTVTVSPDQVVLESVYSYQVVGSQVNRIEIDMPGWQVDSVLPETVVATDRLEKSETSPLGIPLLRTTTATGKFEIRVTAHREIPENRLAVDFILPRPRAASGSAAEVIVAPLDNVELNPRVSELSGLVPDSVPRPWSQGPRQQLALFYRERTDAVESRFIADFQLRKRTVDVSGRNAVRVEAKRVTVEQRFSYRIAYEPLSRLQLSVPVAAWESGDWSAFIENDGAASTPVDSELLERIDVRAIIQLRMATPRGGSLELVVKYDLPRNLPDSEQTIAEAIPLSYPYGMEKSRVGSMQTTLSAAEGWDVECKDPAWVSRTNDQRTSISQEFQASDSAEAERIEFLVHRRTTDRSGTVVLERSWIRSWFAPTKRHDRYSVRLSTTADHVQLRLPSGTIEDSLAIWLNGSPAAATLTDPEILRVDFPDDIPREHCLLELQYALPRSTDWLGKTAIEFPLVLRAINPRQTFWHVIMAGREHLLAGPSGFSTHAKWCWKSFYWDRQARMDDANFEQWLSNESEIALNSQANEYLFSTYGTEDETALRLGNLTILILVVGGLVLLIGLASLHGTWIRHPSLLVLASVSIFAAVSWWPDVAPLLFQAVALGALLAGLGVYLRSLVRRRLIAKGLLLDDSISESPSRFRRRGENSGYNPSTTAAISLQIPAVESKR